MNPAADFDLAVRLRQSGVQLGEVYRFISSLYFRGKLDYAEKFKKAPLGIAGVQIITGAGLKLPETIVNLPQLLQISSTSIDENNSHYRLPLDKDLLRLRELMSDETDVILLGSLATSKYIAPLRAVFEERLLFPKQFLGLGDMSRGGMLLQCCKQGTELEYLPVRAIPRALEPRLS